MIAVDWGTSSLRVYRLDDAGEVRQQCRSDEGVLASQGRFGDVLARQLQGWDDDLILMCGMIGGRGGWHEMPYIDCPGGVDDLARGLQRVSLPGFGDRTVWMMPGLRDPFSDRVPDMMRGEESQLAALLETLPTGPHIACLPGTHSKWVTLRDHRVRNIATAMTGELYALMRQHSILGRSMSVGDSSFDTRAFDAGIERSADRGGLLHHLFGVRASSLFLDLQQDALPSYLSGILIGHEIRASQLLLSAQRTDTVQLIGNAHLLSLYARALDTLGVGVQRHPEDLAARGLHLLWTRNNASAVRKNSSHREYAP